MINQVSPFALYELEKKETNKVTMAIDILIYLCEFYENQFKFKEKFLHLPIQSHKMVQIQVRKSPGFQLL